VGNIKPQNDPTFYHSGAMALANGDVVDIKAN